MEKLLIEGGYPLSGEIHVSGSKNSSLPILFACLLSDKEITLHNVPQLRDIDTSVKMLRILGCDAEYLSDTQGSLTIQARALNSEAPYELVKTMRASILVLGPLLARLQKAKVALPGGCAIGARPVEQHLKALEMMGAHFILEDGYVMAHCKKLSGADISFDFPTVGGTAHLIMSAVLADGTTILRNAAKEPEIKDLANFLNACGAKIQGHGSDTVYIEGVPSLSSTNYSIMPDRIEAGTFIAAAAITGGSCLIKNTPSEELAAVLAKFGEMGMSIQVQGDGVRVSRNASLRAVDMITRPYPGFPTDMQAQIMSLMALAEGTSTIEETIFENRFMHVPELSRMGADIKLAGSRAVIRGVKQLIGAPVMASDLRASASLVVAGLAAKGKTQVQRIYHLDRGYEFIEKKLEQVGAKIKRVKE